MCNLPGRVSRNVTLSALHLRPVVAKGFLLP